MLTHGVVTSVARELSSELNNSSVLSRISEGFLHDISTWVFTRSPGTFGSYCRDPSKETVTSDGSILKGVCVWVGFDSVGRSSMETCTAGLSGSVVIAEADVADERHAGSVSTWICGELGRRVFVDYR